MFKSTFSLEVLYALALSLPASIIANFLKTHEEVARMRIAGRLAADVWPIGAGIVLSALYFRLDLFFVEYWHGVEAVALYNAVFRLVEAMRLLPAAVLAVVFPLLCRAGDLRPLARLAAGLFAGGAAVALVVAGPAGWLVTLFYGPSYAAATPAFRVLREALLHATIDLLCSAYAEPVVRGMPHLASVFPKDVRDFALAVSEAHRIAGGKKARIATPKRSAVMPNAFTSLLSLSADEKKKKGVEFTPPEIFQQPEMWRKTAAILDKQKAQIKAFFKGQQKKRTILLSGAGTSAFIGLCLEPLYNRISGFNTKAVPTTDVITDPNAAFRKGEKYILFHFARSGNSPESVGTFTLAEESQADIKHVVITCNKEGKLAKMGKKRKALLILLPPETNDKSLAMTSSFSSMVVAAEYIAALLAGEDFSPIVEKQARAAEYVMNNYGDHLDAICKKGFTRAVFMGSNTLQGCAKECHLKCQEETDGRVVAKHDSFLGLRHGPEAVINPETLVVYLLSEETFTRKYELDMMYGIKGKGIGQTRLAFCRKAEDAVAGAADIIVEYKEEIPDDFLTPVGVLMGQMLGVLRSLSYGLKPDSPSVAGVISRVVQGVKIYDRPRFYKKGDYKVIAG